MVRHYKPKNRYRKWSKLTNEQIAYILRAYCAGLSVEFVASETQLSTKTIRKEFSLINERSLSDPQLLGDIVEYLSPELQDMFWLIRNVDLSSGSDFWKRLQSCLFYCPAVVEVSLALSSIRLAPALKFAKEINLRDKDHVRFLRIACSACPIKRERDKTTSISLSGMKGIFRHYGWITADAIRAHFLWVVIREGIGIRASAAMTNPPEGVDGRTANSKCSHECARDLAAIFASHFIRTPL